MTFQYSAWVRKCLNMAGFDVSSQETDASHGMCRSVQCVRAAIYGERMEASEVVSVIAEVIGWIALSGGLGCLVLALLIRLADGRWVRTDAVIVDQEHGSTVRWFAEGAFHQRRLSDDERNQVERPDEEPAYYKQREPDRLRMHEPPPGRRIIRMVGVVLLVIAAIAGLIGLVLMFIE